MEATREIDGRATWDTVIVTYHKKHNKQNTNNFFWFLI